MLISLPADGQNLIVASPQTGIQKRLTVKSDTPHVELSNWPRLTNYRKIYQKIK